MAEKKVTLKQLEKRIKDLEKQVKELSEKSHNHISYGM